MEFAKYRSQVRKVFEAGPDDGKFLLHNAESSSEWEALYLASRDSEYATVWRRIFGEHRLSQTTPRSILELAVVLLSEEAQSLQSSLITPEHMFMIKLIANCCIDNISNKKVVVQTDGLLALLKLLTIGVDPNVLVPTIYNICVDFEELSEGDDVDSAMAEDLRKITLTEERLARADSPIGTVYSGLLVLLNSHVVRGCTYVTQGYLSELIEMSSKLAAEFQTNLDSSKSLDLENVIDRLLAEDAGEVLMAHSAQGRINIIRSLFTVSMSGLAKNYLASTGAILRFALAADYHLTADEYLGEDADEQKENAEALDGFQTLMLKLAYDICQAPEFVQSPKYGIARQSLDIVSIASDQSFFAQAVAYIVLYGFVDGDPRAHMLANEGLLSSVIVTLSEVDEKTLIHPALGVATKLALTWSLQSQLWSYKMIRSIQRFIVKRDFGYEIPLCAVTFLRVMIKGHPDRISELSALETNGSILENVFNLFDMGQDAICVEIGLLVIEICATFSFHSDSSFDAPETSLDSIIGTFEAERWSSILIYMATKAQSVTPIVSQRVWLALGLLSIIPNGKKVIQHAFQNPAFAHKVQDVKNEHQPGPAENVRFMLHHMRQLSATAELDTAMDQMALE